MSEGLAKEELLSSMLTSVQSHEVIRLKNATQYVMFGKTAIVHPQLCTDIICRAASDKTCAGVNGDKENVGKTGQSKDPFEVRYCNGILNGSIQAFSYENKNENGTSFVKTHLLETFVNKLMVEDVSSKFGPTHDTGTKHNEAISFLAESDDDVAAF